MLFNSKKCTVKFCTNTTKLAVSPCNHPSFSLLLAPLTSVLDLTTTYVPLCASGIHATHLFLLKIIYGSARGIA